MTRPLSVRPATEDDALDVLAWRNDPQTRAMSRDQGEVDEAGHVTWFARAITDPARTLLIGEAEGGKVGMVRIDRGAETEVSINLNPAFRGQGLSVPLLLAALAGETDVWAEVREENAASIRLFERAGFELRDRRDGLRRYYRLA